MSSEAWSNALWPILGLVLGWGLEPWVLRLPRWVLAPYGDQVQAQDWCGPGGGLDLTPARARRWLLALLNAWLWALMAAWAPAAAGVWAVLAWCLCASTLLVLAVVDWNSTLLPDALLWPLLWAGLLLTERGSTHVDLAHSLWAAAAWYVLLRAVAEGYARWRGHMGMGAGDAKLLAAMAAWWGWEPVVWALMWGALSVPLLAVWLAWRRGRGLREPLPFGPGLVAGVLLWTQWQLLRPA